MINKTNVLRFAPSPTGKMHIGNIRAAIICYLFIKKYGGKFILRIDDTDRERSTMEFEEAIRRDLSWLDITYDESYRQSQRTKDYEAAAYMLKNQGLIYPCYESKEELELRRKILLAQDKPPIYDRSALNFSKEELREKEKLGLRPHWRFKLSQSNVSWKDAIRGEINVNTKNISDPIIIKEDGSFLYGFASVVDDIFSNVTHIFRGSDHIVNTACQIEMFRALAGTCNIVFGHYPLISPLGGGGLSKRKNSMSIEDLRNAGFLKDTIVNILSRLGTSLPVGNFTLDELVSSFEMGSFSQADTRFSMDLFYEINHKFINSIGFENLANYEGVSYKLCDLLESEWDSIRGELLVLRDVEFWHEVFKGGKEILLSSFNLAHKGLVNGNISLPSGVFNYILRDGEDKKVKVISNFNILSINYQRIIGEAIASMEKTLDSSGTWQVTDVKTWVKEIKDKLYDVENREIFKTLRYAISGLDHGYEFNVLMSLIDPNIIRGRLKHVLKEYV